jgi:phage major head subunit gpT-like protein
MIINQANLKDLQKGFRLKFDEGYQGASNVLWESLAQREQSSNAVEYYVFPGALVGMRKLAGEVVIQNAALQRFAIPNEEWEATIQVPQADIERDSIGAFHNSFRNLGAVGRKHPDELVAALLANGFDADCYTGKSFFDTDHEPVKGGKKFSNAGTKKLSRDNFRTARAAMLGRVNPAGRPLGLGVALQLVVSPKNESLAREIVVADRGANGASNVDFGTAKLVVFPELAALNEDAWFLLETGRPLRPLVVQIEKEPTVNMVTAENDSFVVLKHQFLFQCYGRYNAGYGLPELAYGSDGSAAA